MKSLLALATLLAAHAVSHGAEIVVTMNAATAGGTGASAGTVRIVETPYGLAFLPTLTGLPPGLHGFHVHEKPSCAPGEQSGAMAPAIGAGGHLDPAGTKKHGTPWGDGHLGDLPALYVAADGTASTPVVRNRCRYSCGVAPTSRAKVRRSVSAERRPLRRAIAPSGASEVSSSALAASTRACSNGSASTSSAAGSAPVTCPRYAAAATT